MTVSERVRQKRKQLDRLRPLSAATLAELERWYDVQLTYTSNALEGNTLTLSETALVLEKGITVHGKPLKDHLEAAGHRDALGYVRALASERAPVTELDVRNLHRLIMQRLDPDEAGRYSRHQRLISGSPLVLPSPVEVPPRMQELASALASGGPMPEFAFDAHEALVTVHPFSDGNGRTARLLMNVLLIQAGWPPVPIYPEDRPAYHEALAAVQLHGDRNAYHAFMLMQLERSLDHYLLTLRRGIGDRT